MIGVSATNAEPACDGGASPRGIDNECGRLIVIGSMNDARAGPFGRTEQHRVEGRTIEMPSVPVCVRHERMESQRVLAPRRFVPNAAQVRTMSELVEHAELGEQRTNRGRQGLATVRHGPDRALDDRDRKPAPRQRYRRRAASRAASDDPDVPASCVRPRRTVPPS